MKKLLAALILITILTGCGVVKTYNINNLKYIQSTISKDTSGITRDSLIFEDKDGKMHVLLIEDKRTMPVEVGRIYDVVVSEGDSFTIPNAIVEIRLSGSQ